MILDAANYSDMCKCMYGNVNKRRWTRILKYSLLFFMLQYKENGYL